MNNEEQHQAAKVILHNMQFTTLASQMLLATALEVPLFCYYEIGEAADSIMAVRPNGRAILAVLVGKTAHLLSCYVKEGEDQLTQQKTLYVFPNEDTAGHVWEVITEQLDEWVNGEREAINIIEHDLEF
jgi:hypothetical protein